MHLSYYKHIFNLMNNQVFKFMLVKTTLISHKKSNLNRYRDILFNKFIINKFVKNIPN